MEVPPPKDYLRAALAEACIPIVAECSADALEPDDFAGADVILVTLDEAMEPFLDRVTDLAVGSSLPVVFEDAEFSSQLSGWDRNRWLRHLCAKLTGSDDTRPPLPGQAANADTAPERTAEDAGGAESVWVLGASIGGPEAIRRFLEALPGDVPAAFLLVQHMGAEFQRVFAERLARVTGLDVVCAEDGQTLVPGRVIVAPVEQRLTFDAAERVHLTRLEIAEGPSPSIDHALFEVAEHFGNRGNAIIFSGRDRDGVDGCAELKQRGGRVWVQDTGSATISVTADAIRESGLAGFVGPPERLAARLVETERARELARSG